MKQKKPNPPKYIIFILLFNSLGTLCCFGDEMRQLQAGFTCAHCCFPSQEDTKNQTCKRSPEKPFADHNRSLKPLRQRTDILRGAVLLLPSDPGSCSPDLIRNTHREAQIQAFEDGTSPRCPRPCKAFHIIILFLMASKQNQNFSATSGGLGAEGGAVFNMRFPTFRNVFHEESCRYGDVYILRDYGTKHNLQSRVVSYLLTYVGRNPEITKK